MKHPEIVYVLVNTRDSEDTLNKEYTDCALAFKDAVAKYPEWTSVVITIVNRKTKEIEA